jgi:ketosteroid isomerase-like protein
MFRRLTHLFEYLFRRERLEDELDEELRSSFDMIVDRFVAAGMSAPDARRAARLEFEGLQQVKENVRDGLVGSGIEASLEDMRYALRGLRRRPSFTAIALVTLALGIGVNTAVFSVFYEVLLHPLPYHDPERLAIVWTSFRTAGHARAPVSGAILREIEKRNRSLAGVAGIWTITRTFTGDNPEQVKCARVTANFFDVLGVHAAAGRTFAKQDNGGPVIVLTDGFFRRRFAGDRRLLGKSLPMDWDDTLVGTLPPDFQLHFAADSNVPPDVQVFDTFDDHVYEGRKQYFIRVVARLKRGVSIAEAQRDLDRVATEIGAAYAEYTNEDLHFTLAGLQAELPDELLTMDPGNGEWGDRQAALEGSAQFAAAGGKLKRLEFPKTEIQAYGDVAVVYSNYLYEIEQGGKPFVNSGRATEVFVHRNGAWVNPSWHLDSR